MTFCPFCQDPILDYEDVRMINGNPRGCHLECLMRSINGSVGHQTGQCECNKIKDVSEDGMTAREAAIASFRHWKSTHKDYT